MTRILYQALLAVIFILLLSAMSCTSKHTDGSANLATIPVNNNEIDMLENTRIYFAYNSTILSTESKAALKMVVVVLNSYPDIKLTIEGYCDERETADHNYKLGKQRARAAYNYMLELGANASQMSTVSYGEKALAGKEHPQNRRAEFKVNLEREAGAED